MDKKKTSLSDPPKIRFTDPVGPTITGPLVKEEPLTESEISSRIIDFFSSAAWYITIETEEGGGESFVKVHVESEFLKTDEEKAFYGSDLHSALVSAAKAWRQQCLQQCQLLEATLAGLRLWHALDNTIDKV